MFVFTLFAVEMEHSDPKIGLFFYTYFYITKVLFVLKDEGVQSKMPLNANVPSLAGVVSLFKPPLLYTIGSELFKLTKCLRLCILAYAHHKIMIRALYET